MLVYGGSTYAFTYNDEGIRTSKSSNGNTTTYYYSAGLLIGESDNTQTIVFIYDAEGAPLGMRYRTHTQSSGSWTTYWFEKNLQGDIVAVYNSAGTKILSYKCDAWGNFVSIPHATDSIGGASKNPFRYRGYYYDSDLGFYVTGTRCYDPKIGRFINADSVMSGASGSLQGCNLYAYCFNNPIMLTDENGNWPEWLKDIGQVFVAVWESIEIEIGVGMGVGFTADVIVDGVAAGGTLLYSESDALVMDDGSTKLIHQTEISMGVSVMFAEIGYSDVRSHAFGDPMCDCGVFDNVINKSTCPAQEKGGGFECSINYSLGIYLGVGGKVSIGINVAELTNRVISIFSD